MGIAPLEVGAIALAWLATLIWSLVVILTTPVDMWESARMSQLLWLIVAVFMPIIGAGLFAFVGRPMLTRSAAGPTVL